ncbi:MAG TPA: S41 family peptidase [Pirellulales bacterium]|jgi:carboxyl-terminal processing protease|nr:S41 family peptidase [Pirellulales bacterium]
MLSRARLRLLVALCAILLSASPAAWAQSQLRIIPPQDNQAVAAVLERGQKFEQQRKWADALTLYEEAAKRFPDNAVLDQHFNSAKMHYDLGRRYNDASFRNCIATLSETQALDLYSEVLLKVQTHYVANPDWQTMIVRGTRCLDLAVVEPAFVERQLKNVAAEKIDGFRQELATLINARPVRTRQDARDMVTAVERLAALRLAIPGPATVMEYISGATGSLDEYSSYLTPDQLTDVYSQIEGNFVGLGIELKAADQALLIVRVIPNSPAERSGIKAGDRITAVDGHSVQETNTDQAAEMLQGREGTVVEVVVVTGKDEPRRLRVRREHVDVPSVDDVKILDAQQGIGYLKLVCFQKTTSKDMDAALWKLNRDGMRSLIMDLRGNPGGLLTASVDVADKFIDDGIIVSTRGRSPQEDFNYSARKGGSWQVPLVVLIDGDSASASEIFAGAVRDHHRATLVGVRSYGKGSVQGIFPLSLAGAGLRLTTAKFYSPNGLPFAKVGVEPDILVRSAAKPLFDPNPAEPPVAPALIASGETGLTAIGPPEDATLAAGLQAARKQLAQR